MIPNEGRGSLTPTKQNKKQGRKKAVRRKMRGLKSRRRPGRMGRIMVGGNEESRKRRTDTARYEKGLR